MIYIYQWPLGWTNYWCSWGNFPWHLVQVLILLALLYKASPWGRCVALAGNQLGSNSTAASADLKACDGDQRGDLPHFWSLLEPTSAISRFLSNLWTSLPMSIWFYLYQYISTLYIHIIRYILPISCIAFSTYVYDVVCISIHIYPIYYNRVIQYKIRVCKYASLSACIYVKTCMKVYTCMYVCNVL